jgi:hypothetical protein
MKSDVPVDLPWLPPRVRTEATIKVFSKEFSGKATFSEK